MQSAPLASVIIPSYNYGRFIEEAVESVLNQDFPREEIEIIVADDGSTDETARKIKKYGSRIRYLPFTHAGKAWAVKAALEASRGKYVFNLDADDVFLARKIRTVVDIFEHDPEIVHCVHPVLYWYPDRGIEKTEKIPKQVLGRKIPGEDLALFFARSGKFYGGGSSFSGRA